MRSHLGVRWVAMFTLGELVGFGLIPGLLGSAAYAWSEVLEPGPRALLHYLIGVVGGFGEGATLAWFQLLVLRDVWPELSRRRWNASTALAASTAWALGMLAPTLDDLFSLSTELQLVIWIPAFVLILLSIGAAQALVLRAHVRHAWRWCAANVLGWLLGLPWTFLLPMSLPDDAPAAWFFAAFLVGGVLMGATAGAVTAVALRGLVRVNPPGS